MNIDNLKSGFRSYLEEKGKLNEENESQFNENNNNLIYSYANEFKAYLQKKCNTSGINIQSKSVSELLKMEISASGKIIDPEESDTYETTLNSPELGEEADVAEPDAEETNDEDAESEEVDEDAVVTDVKDELTQEVCSDIPDAAAAAEIVDNFEGQIADAVGEEASVEGIEESDIFFDVFNELLQNDQFQGAIDADGKDGISNDEFAGFINSIKGLDENEEDVSIDDLLTASSQINEGNFNYIFIPNTETNHDSETPQTPSTTVSDSVDQTTTTEVQTVPSNTDTVPAGEDVTTGEEFTDSTANTCDMTTGGCDSSSGALDSMNSELDGLQAEKADTEADLSNQTNTLETTQSEKEQVVGGLCGEIENGNCSLSTAQDDMAAKAEVKESAQCELQQAQQNTQCSQQQADQAGNCLKEAQNATIEAQDTSDTAANNNQQAIEEEGQAQADSDDANNNLDTAVGNTNDAQGVADTRGQELDAATVAADEAFSVYNVKNAKVQQAQSEYDNAKAQQENASQNIFQKIANWVKSAWNALTDAICQRDHAQAEAERKAAEEEKAQIASDEALDALEERKQEQDEAQIVADAAQTVLERKTGEREVSDQEYADAIVALASSMEAEENAESEYTTAFDNYIQMHNYQVDAEGRLQDADGNYISATQVAQELETYVQGLMEQRDTKETEYDAVIVATTEVISGNESKIQELDSKIADLQERIQQEEEKIALQETMITELSTQQSEINAANGSGGMADGIASFFGFGSSDDQQELDDKKTLLEEALKSGDSQKIAEAYRAIYGDREVVIDASGNIVNPAELTEEQLAQCSVANVKDLSDENLSTVMTNEAATIAASAQTMEVINNGSIVCDGEEIQMEDINAILKEQVAAMSGDMDNAVDRQGIISKGAGALNNILGIGTSETEARAQIDVYQQLAAQLDACTDPVEYAALFKQITGKDFSMEAVAELLAYDKVSKGEGTETPAETDATQGEKYDITSYVNTITDAVNGNEELDQNALSLTKDNPAREAIEDYKETQETAKDAVIGVASGVVSTVVVTACSVAGVCAAPFTAGASLGMVAAGFGIAGATGAAVSAGLNAVDSIYDADGNGDLDFNYSLPEFGKDLLIGGLNGIVGNLSNGAGAAVTRAVSNHATSATAQTVGRYAGAAAEGFIDGSIGAGGEYTINAAFDETIDFSFEQFMETTLQGGAFGAVTNVGFTAIGDAASSLKKVNSTPDVDLPALEAHNGSQLALTDGVTDVTGDAASRAASDAVGDSATDAAGRAAADGASDAAGDAAGKAAADGANDTAKKAGEDVAISPRNKNFENLSDEIEETFGYRTQEQLSNNLKPNEVAYLNKGDIHYVIKNENGTISIISKTPKVECDFDVPLSNRTPAGSRNPGIKMSDALSDNQKRVYNSSYQAYVDSKDLKISHNHTNTLTSDNVLHGTNLNALIDDGGILDEGLIPREFSGRSAAQLADGTIPDTLTPMCSDVWDVTEDISISDYFDSGSNHWKNEGESLFLPQSYSQSGSQCVIVFDTNSIDPTIMNNSFSVNEKGVSVLFENGNMSRGHNYPTHRAIPVGAPSNSIEKIIIDVRRVNQDAIKKLKSKIAKNGLDIKLYDIWGREI